MRVIKLAGEIIIPGARVLRLKLKKLKKPKKTKNVLKNLGFYHWHRPVKNIGWANQNIGVQKAVESDKCIGVSLLLGGACLGCPPKSTPMVFTSPETDPCHLLLHCYLLTYR